MQSYGDRCCGKLAPSGMTSPAREGDNTCSHEFFLVRIDRKTGETAYVPNLTGTVATARLDVKRHEWRKGVPS